MPPSHHTHREGIPTNRIISHREIDYYENIFLHCLELSYVTFPFNLNDNSEVRVVLSVFVRKKNRAVVFENCREYLADTV